MWWVRYPPAGLWSGSAKGDRPGAATGDAEIRHGQQDMAAERPGKSQAADSQSSIGAAQRISALGEMTSGIAHDFRNILGVIDSGLRLAGESTEDEAKLRACLAAANDGVARGLRLTSRLLAFAKRQELDPRPQNLNDLLKDLEIFLKYGAGPDIRVVLDLAPNLPACLVDPPQFNAAILNLVINARDAMPDGGMIRVTSVLLANDERCCSSAEATCVRVQVRDDGAGMPPEVLSRIFDPYFTTKGEIGTGLGLPQVAAYIKSAGGQINVDSVVGGGTEFNLLFPALPLPPTSDYWRQIDRWVNEGGADKPVAIAREGG